MASHGPWYAQEPDQGRLTEKGFLFIFPVPFFQTLVGFPLPIGNKQTQQTPPQPRIQGTLQSGYKFVFR